MKTKIKINKKMGNKPNQQKCFFIPILNTTSATTCAVCGKEKSEHVNELTNNVTADLVEKINGGHVLTKREYFAAMAMQGLLTRVPDRPNHQTDLGVTESKRIAVEAVLMSDELIQALNKHQENEN
jgi:hypothetical protein